MKESTRREPGAKPPARSNNAKYDTAKNEGRSKGTATALGLEPHQAGGGGALARHYAERGEEALSSVVFVQLPKEALDKLGFPGIEAGAPLPVQMPGAVRHFDASLVSVESVIAGILRVLAWQPQNKYSRQYRELVKTLRPGLLAELSDAGIAKAQ